MYARKSLKGGRGFGLFTVARLDYVEKLQNYDWVVADVNILDAIPGIAHKKLDRDMDKLSMIFSKLTSLTQEHYGLFLNCHHQNAKRSKQVFYAA